MLRLMLWQLLLAHFLADYLFQTSWMVANKRRPSVLGLHAGVHFVVMLALVSPAWQTAWPYLLLLAAIHFSIDAGKNWLNVHRPDWVIGPYLVDQGLHYLSLIGISLWIGPAPPGGLFLSPELAVYLTGFLLATYVWFISERVMTYAAPQYRQEVLAQAWPRMLARAGMLVILLGGTVQISAAPGLAGSALALPYFSGKFGRRALLTDLAVVLGTLVFIRMAA